MGCGVLAKGCAGRCGAGIVHQKQQKVVENKGRRYREWYVRCWHRQGSGFNGKERRRRWSTGIGIVSCVHVYICTKPRS